MGLEYELQELRNLLGLEIDKMERWVDFKRYVIEAALKEINELTDLRVRYKAIKGGRAVCAVQFILEKKTGADLSKSQKAVERRIDPKKAMEYEELPY